MSRRAARYLLLPIALAGCSSEESTSQLTEEHPTIEAIYGAMAETRLVPFPSDRYTARDPYTTTGLRLAISKSNTKDEIAALPSSVLEEANELDGFSPIGGLAIGFTGPLDFRGLGQDPRAEPPVLDPLLSPDTFTKPTSPLLLVDIDPSSPKYGAAIPLVTRYYGQPADDVIAYDEYTLIAQPTEPLAPSTRYLFVGTRALHATDGTSVGRSKATAALFADTTSDYGREVNAGLEVTAKLGVKASEVVVASAFTTESVLDGTLALAARARTQAPPALAAKWTVETPLAPPDKRVRFRATYMTPEYRRPMPDGKWQMGSQGPVAQKHIPLELYLAFSDATKSGKRPVVIFQHGLGGSKDASWGTADRLAGISERGAAVIAIDSPEHGARAADPGANAFFAALSFFGVDQATQTFDVGRARDNFRQMASDQLELVRLIDALATLDLLPIGAPDGIPDLDVSQIYYLGHSFGSVQGPTIAALAPEIHAAVWNVGGDALMTLLRDSGTFGLLVNSLRPTGMPDGALARFFVLGQAIVDPGDPIHYARFVTREPTPGQTGWAPRDVLLQEVVEDNVVPNSTSEALARAAGLTLVNSIVDIPGLPKDKAPLTGNFPGGATGAISQFDKMDDGMPAEHGGLIFSKEARAQYVEFFKSVITKGHGTVNPPY